MGISGILAMHVDDSFVEIYPNSKQHTGKCLFLLVQCVLQRSLEAIL